MLAEQFLDEMGLTGKEIKIFLSLYKLGMKPASTVAQHVGLERTYVYKTLKNLVAQNLVYETRHAGVTNFHIPDSSVLRKRMDNKKQTIDQRNDQFASIEAELAQYEQKKVISFPKITFYDTHDGIKNCFSDIYDTANKYGYLVITFFASNTFESVSGGKTIQVYAQDLFSKCKHAHITIDTLLGNGMLVMETITKESNVENIVNLPAGNSAINIFLLGRFVYFIMFKDVPYAVKIESEEMATAMHFLFSKLQIE